MPDLSEHHPVVEIDVADLDAAEEQVLALGARKAEVQLGSVPTVFGLMARSLFDRRLPRPDFEGPDRPPSMAHLREFLQRGGLTPIVGHLFALEDVPDAIALLASGRAVGRIVVAP